MWCAADSLMVADRVGLATLPPGWCPGDSLMVANRVGLATIGRGDGSPPPHNYRPWRFSTFPQLVRKNGSICRFPHCEKRRDPFGRKGFQLLRTGRNTCFPQFPQALAREIPHSRRGFPQLFHRAGGFSTGLSTGPLRSFFFFHTVSTRCDPREKG